MKTKSNKKIEWKKLGEISLSKGQYGSGAKKVDFNDRVRYVRITDIDDDGNLKKNEMVSPSRIEKEYFLEDDDLLFARSGSVGRTYIHYSKDNLRYQFAGYLIRFKINPNIAIAKYIYYFTKSKSYKKWINSFKKNVTLSNINAKEYASLEIPIPLISTQKQIISILEKTENLKQKRKTNSKETDKIIQSIFYEMFGNPVKNDKNFDVEELKNLVSKEKYSLKRGPFGGSLKKEIFVPDGYKVYEQKNAIHNNFEIGGYYINKDKYGEMKPFSIKPNDLIISCSGTIGKIAIVPKEIKPGIINQALLKITFDNKKVLPLFGKYLLETPQIQKRMFGSARGSGIKNVASMPTIKSTKLIAPPINLQIKFAEQVKKIEKIKQHQQKSEQGINTLFDALMQKAFKGELGN